MNHIQLNWKWGVFEGIILLLLGLIAITHPVFTTLSLSVVIGSILVISGIMLTWRTFKNRNGIEYWPNMLTGVIVLIIGIFILYRPLVGVFTLSGLLIAFFIVQGLNSLFVGFQNWKQTGAGWFVAHGILSLLMVVILLKGWPTSALWFLGLLFGINLMMFGMTLISFSFLARKFTPPEDPMN